MVNRDQNIEVVRKVRILLVNPPIYDFSAFDFWLKPYGLLRVAGFLRNRAEFRLFDFLDPASGATEGHGPLKRDAWGRGKFPSVVVDKPDAFSRLRRRYRRYGLTRDRFREYLAAERMFDYVMIQSTMTYWYRGIKEVIEDILSISPKTKIILGGNYTTICSDHARKLGADLVIEGNRTASLWKELGIEPDLHQPPLWEAYRSGELAFGVMRLSDGCPFRCTYCSVPSAFPNFTARPLGDVLEELYLLANLGVRNIAFYDDALLFKPESVLLPFLDALERNHRPIRAFHTPNALNARFLNARLARRMVDAGFQTFFIGFESGADNWQKTTGGKVYAREFESAVGHLLDAGIAGNRITCYLITGHPLGDLQQLESSMRAANALGVRVMLSEFSPIPGTPDGERCREWIDLDEPLNHNKTAFTRLMLGEERTQELKNLANELNHSLVR